MRFANQRMQLTPVSRASGPSPSKARLGLVVVMPVRMVREQVANYKQCPVPQGDKERGTWLTLNRFGQQVK